MSDDARPTLGSETVVMAAGLLLGSILGWVVPGMLILPTIEQEPPDAWLGLVYVVVGIVVTALHMLALGAFAGVRAVVYRRSERRTRWSSWWAWGGAAVISLFAAAMSSSGGWNSGLFLVPGLVTLGVYAVAIRLAMRVRLPNGAVWGVGAAVTVVALVVVWPILGVMVS
jgi:hypothetical protein